MAHAIRKPNDNSLLHEREDNTGSGGSLPLSPTRGGRLEGTLDCRARLLPRETASQPAGKSF